ncbi:hypothetical protein HPMG_01448 [Helicobacter pullorum MIT 98-5489]|uniref:Uncharacterized protein n=1 Tax=Helicobacter pullorum MIT 98-5489 TaxID=537972 RepID=C5F0H8_9HELI|nr:hypothetical protein HPMG_01448 [Helicobacter pullorum MIT 98-5489]
MNLYSKFRFSIPKAHFLFIPKFNTKISVFIMFCQSFNHSFFKHNNPLIGNICII